MPIIYKSADEIQKMSAAGRLAADVLDYIEDFVKPGVTTEYLDDLCRDYIESHGSVSADFGYGNPPYPKYTCISVNHVICHGIPSQKKLNKGDILNIDITVIVDGYHGDTSRMYVAGEPSVIAKRLIATTYDAMWAGINMVKPGATLGDIGHACQQVAESQRFSVVREYCGHGIGVGFHEEPYVLHYGTPGKGEVLKEGMCFTIEPMVNAGKRDLKTLGDGWTVVTKDHSLSAQWEHTMAVTENGVQVFTLSKAEREAGGKLNLA